MWCLLLLFALGISGSYVPGTPGAVWSKEEVDIVREKVKEMINIRNWRSWNKKINNWGGAFHFDGTFSNDGSTAFSDEHRWCSDCKGGTWEKQDVSLANVPSTAQLLRLGFHDCVPYIKDDGSLEGGCDGCIHWANMGFGYGGFPGGKVKKDYAPVSKGDNNGLQTTVAALENIYTNPAWPSTAPPMEKSLRDTGKSRADLWQFAANVALEVEIERANFGCDYDFNAGNQVRLLESEEKCYFKLFKPAVFKFGRIDCIPEESKKETDFPYEATGIESHPNVYGSAKHVVDNLKHDFDLTAREGISLMAAHATSGQHHNFRLPFKYQWPGNPYLSNMYFKYLAGTGHYRRYKGLTPRFPTSVGDSQGKPPMGNLWKVKCAKIWKSDMTENGWGGPCFWRPTQGNCRRPGEESSKTCFDHFAADGSIVKKTGKKGKNCETVTYDENRIQYSSPVKASAKSKKKSCGTELTFALSYEVNFMLDFELDEEFRPHGCNGSLDTMLWSKFDWGNQFWTYPKTGETSVTCGPNMERYENKEALSEMTVAFAEDHDVWNKAFMDGWEKISTNGYTADQLVAGPEYSWLGRSYFDGSYSDASFPIVFTNNKKANPTISSTKEEKFRENCVGSHSDQCPPEFKRDHEDYFLGRLESPLACQEEESTVDSIPIKIRNVKDGKMLQINIETGNFEIAEASESDNQMWTLTPSCGAGAVLTNLATSSTSNWEYNPEMKTLRNERGFVQNHKKKGLKFAPAVRYRRTGNTPWYTMQWEPVRA